MRAGIFASAVVPDVGPAPQLALRGSWAATNMGFSHSDVPLGPDHPDRKVLIGMSSQTTSTDPWTITVNGVAPTLVLHHDSRRRLWLFELDYPTGGSADFTGSGPGGSNLLAAVWTVLGDLVEVHDAETNGTLQVAMPSTLIGDAVVAISMGFFSTTQPTWSGGVTEVAEGVGGSTNRSSAADGIAVADAPTVGAAWGTGKNLPSLLAASYRWDGV